MADENLDLKIKLQHLTIVGAREFWQEITEWLDAIINNCTRDYDKVKTLDELKEKQILKRLCERLKYLPDGMAETLKAKLAEPSSGDITDEERLNFIAEPIGVKTREEANG